MRTRLVAAESNRLAIAAAFAEEQLDQYPDISAIFVTGSAARDDGVESSDIDIKLLIPDIPPTRIFSYRASSIITGLCRFTPEF